MSSAELTSKLSSTALAELTGLQQCLSIPRDLGTGIRPVDSAKAPLALESNGTGMPPLFLQTIQPMAAATYAADGLCNSTVLEAPTSFSTKIEGQSLPLTGQDEAR